jgi:hypothetical protein
MTIRDLVLTKMESGEKPVQVISELVAEVVLLLSTCPYDDLRRLLADDIMAFINTAARPRGGPDKMN